MADSAQIPVPSASAVEQIVGSQNVIVSIFGYHVNVILMAILLIFLGLLYMFYTIQKSGKLDFADMLTKDGRKVSLTKLLQLLGGITGTWAVIKMAAANTLSPEVFGIYLTYVAAVDGYAKFMVAKYGYSETSVKDGGVPTDPPSDSPQKTLQNAVDSATDAEASARDAKVAAKNAAIDLKSQDQQ